MDLPRRNIFTSRHTDVLSLCESISTLSVSLPQSEGSAYQETSFEYSDDYYIHFTVSIDSYRDLSSPESEYKFVLTEEGRNIPFLKQKVNTEIEKSLLSNPMRSDSRFSFGTVFFCGHAPTG